MPLSNLIQATKHEESMFLKVQEAYLIYLDKIIELNTGYYNDLHASLTKNINHDIQNNDVGLKEVVDVLVGVYSDAKEEIILAKAKLYYLDGEKYHLIGDQRTYNYFKRRVSEEFKKIKNPELIKQFKDEMGAYLPKN